MLTELTIVDLGVIASARLEPAVGLTVVTGETGAGKTLVVTGLGLLLAPRGDPGLIRPGQPRARVEARFADPPAAVREQVDAMGGELDQGELILTRQVAPGRSRAAAGGVGLPAAAAARLGAELVTIHGQFEAVRLDSPARQRALLDRAAGPAQEEALERYTALYEARRQHRAELAELVGRAQERIRQADALRFGLEQIARVDPQPREDEALQAEARRLQAGDELRQVALSALAALAGDDAAERYGALTGLAQARRGFDQLAGRDPAARPLADQADQLLLLGNELAGQAAAYLADQEADPVRLEQVAARLAALQPLTRRYGADVDQVIAWAERAQDQLAQWESADDRAQDIRATLDRLEVELAALASDIGARRRATAARLQAAVEAELTDLALPQARLQFAVTALDEPGPQGQDRVEIWFAANPGSSPQPLAKAASGGELSRVRLALELVLVGTDEPTTLVFDEIDAGIGGAVGAQVGRRLARLARWHQVVVVTHLAQVAAFGQRHFVVQKAASDQTTTTAVRRLDESERPAELARMMAGLEDSAGAQQAAGELLALAREAAETVAAPLRREDAGRA
ncbi:MAG: DNA repair protein RecN [Propionibacteriaceae bacterium]|jgi:DNA repair protein RecN (Recombination protein N)|nr:DNA repair protein RecN [Propionibacteriaceae bacterium]